MESNINTPTPPKKTFGINVKKTEVVVGLFIILYAFLMSAMEITSSNLNDKMMIAYNKMISYTGWYQSKSIKQTLKESEVDYLEALMKTSDVSEEGLGDIKSKISQAKSKMLKYEAEKTEILVGSSKVPRQYWAQDLNGEMGKIIGINEWEESTRKYDQAINKIDVSILLFQIGIILGAVCIITYGNPKIQRLLLMSLTVFGVLGVVYAIIGYSLIP
ncbi:DUF4337 family protein [Sediminicola luteus]|uniref:DUF4337 domain-containing protein n=1 Tax=Sediminicola luteus TaxID=319238 RepID=A0A2A4G3T6_9FLAO|nr:DUF4337 family protein [Sediminicola luteus]PCE62422.1 hypothetical protein B7P33_18890 [Sediminicola luteus]